MSDPTLWDPATYGIGVDDPRQPRRQVIPLVPPRPLPPVPPGPWPSRPTGGGPRPVPPSNLPSPSSFTSPGYTPHPFPPGITHHEDTPVLTNLWPSAPVRVWPRDILGRPQPTGILTDLGPAPSSYIPSIQRYAQQYNVPPQLLTALIRAESNFDPGIVSSEGAIGLGQLEPGTARNMGVGNPRDPDQNIMGAAKYLRQLYNQYGSWSRALSAYNRGPAGAQASNFSLAGYQQGTAGPQLIAMARGLDAGGYGGVPPQNYIPASYTPPGGSPSMMPDRPASEWGTDPDMSDAPGNLPHEREFPSVMRGLASIILGGLLTASTGGAAIGMLTAFGAYQNARNRRQLIDQELARTHFRDQLAETKAKLQEEQIAASGVMTGTEPGSQQQLEALRRIALHYNDRQLMAAVESGDPHAAERLFQARDKAYQDISKTDFSLQKQELEIQKLQLDQQIQDLKYREAQAKDPLEIQKLRDETTAAEAKRRALERQEQEFPGTTGIGDAPAAEASPSARAPDTTPPAAAPSAAPSPSAAPTPAPPAAAPSTGGLPPRFGPAGPPAGYSGPDAPAPPPPAAPSPPPPSPERREALGTVPPGTTPEQAGFTGIETQEDGRQPSEADVENAENNTWKLGRELLHGGEPPSGMAPGVNQGAEVVRNHLASQLNGLATSGLTGSALVDAVRKVDDRAADILDKVMTNRDQLPAATGFGARMQDYRQMLAQLAFAAAPPDLKSGDAGWQPGQYQLLQDFSDKNKREQFILSRANSMAVSASNVMRDLKALMQNPDYSPDALSTAIDNLNKGTVAGSGIYTNLANDLLAFTQEDQAVRSGTPTVTETGEQVRTVQRLWVPGSVEQIRGFLSHNIETANARITGDQTWWKRMHGYGTMVGYVPEASAVITAMQHLNEKTGKYDNLPQGYTLPPDLAASMPTDSENARAVTAASTGSAQTAPTNPSWATGSATGPQGRKLYKGSDGHWYNPDHTLAQ